MFKSFVAMLFPLIVVHEKLEQLKGQKSRFSVGLFHLRQVVFLPHYFIIGLIV